MRYTKTDQQAVQNFSDKKEFLRKIRKSFVGCRGKINYKNGFVIVESRMNFK